MALYNIIRAVDQLSADDLETLYVHVSARRSERAAKAASERETAEMLPAFVPPSEAFSESDLDELEWALSAEALEPLMAAAGV